MSRPSRQVSRRPADATRAGIASILAVVAIPCLVGAQEAGYPAAARTAAPDAELPWDPQLRTGRLDNGLRYYVRVNDEPENRAELRLVVNAGSVLEDEDQLGLAHFVEHMAFNGTENFAKQELVEFMESIGMGFGADLNAYTSFDETVYMLRIPTDDPEIVGTAFQILDDWAHAVSFEPEEVDKERGVVIEEWRLGQGAQARVRDQQFPVLFRGSRYAERLPIGSVEVLESFDRDTLVRFYEDWYRPELMGVVAVGDFDADVIESMIRERFGALDNPDEPRPRLVYDVPEHEATLSAITSDPEITSTSVSVYHKLEPPAQGTVADYRRSIVQQLYNGILNARFGELARRPDPPFIGASSGYGLFVRGQGVYSVGAAVPDGGVERGLETLFVEAERVELHGFTPTELERRKRAVLRSMERAYTDRANRSSASYAAEYIRNLLQDEPVPGIEYEYELYQRFVPEIGLDEVNAVGRDWIGDRNRVVLVTAPEAPDAPLPSEEDLLAVLGGVREEEIGPWEDSVADDAVLLPEPPTPGTVASTREIPELGVIEWTLSNDARVVLKPTDFRDDQILFTAFSPGGTSLVPDDESLPARTAAQVVSLGGLGQYDSIDLGKILADKAASASPFISSLEEGLSGQASPRDLETLFQIIHMRFTAPRRDPQLFDVWKQQVGSLLANRDADPSTAFGDRLNEILSQEHPRARPLTLERLDETDLDASFAFYEERFADAGDFTFVFVGTFEPDALRPLVETYIASLPSIDRQESWRDLDIGPPPGVVRDRVERGLEPRSQTTLVFTGDFDYDDRTQRNSLRTLGEVLQMRLRNVLREDLGGTYGVGVGPSMDWRPDETYQVRISFGSDPERVDELVDTVFAEIDRMKTEGPDPDDVEDVIEQFRRSFETSREQNGFWLGQLAAYWRRGDDPRSILEYEESLAEITPAVVQEAARRYLDTNRYVLLSLVPEAQQAVVPGLDLSLR